MANIRPLALKRQVGRPGKSEIAALNPIARVWVETGVFHLDEPYDYLVPAAISENVAAGVRVEVPFGSSQREGIVLERTPHSAGAATLKEISKVLSPYPVATETSLKLISNVANRWAGIPYDIVRSAIPPQAKLVKLEQMPDDSPEVRLGSTPFARRDLPKEFEQQNVRAFWSVEPIVPLSNLLLDLIAKRLQFGQVLILMPEERSLIRMKELLIQRFHANLMVRIDGHETRSDRYQGYLSAISGQARVILGLRGGVFAPLIPGATVILVDESSHHYYETRAPGWNARDVALLRANSENLSLILVGYSPSLESARLVETGWLKFISSKTRTSVLACDTQKGELIPSPIFSLVRKSLKNGPVLFLAPRKGYGNAVMCNKCRNLAQCECGGKLQKYSAHADPRCVICAKEYALWSCSWCGSREIYIAARGIDRFVEEVGKSFPNYPLHNSSGDHIIDNVSNSPSLVLATPGSIPLAESGYAAVILLQGQRFFGHSDLRSTERARELFFGAAAQASESGLIGVVIDRAHPIVAALTTWDPINMVRRELRDREEAQLPPYSRILFLEVEITQGTAIRSGLVRARQEQRIPSSCQILGPHDRSSGKSRITVSVPLAESQMLLNFVHELQRKRSISGKPLFTLRVDPYSLE